MLLRMTPIVDEIRSACARVARAPRHVRIAEERIEDYARTLPSEVTTPTRSLRDWQLEEQAAFWLQLHAISFGSGWFPTLQKPSGMSGFQTIEAGLKNHGPWPAEQLAHVTTDEVAAAFEQDPEHPLVFLFGRHLRELGERVLTEWDGSFLALARSGNGSAVALAEELGSWIGWMDVSVYNDTIVPFFKRAQIAAADLHLHGIAPASDLDRLTLFAGNLVPHVLRVDRVLRFEAALARRVDTEQLIVPHSSEEIEIRACAVHAVELLVAAHGSTTAAAVDKALWDRGARARYEAIPRPRARCTTY
jgi:putative queuosine salvage protein